MDGIREFFTDLFGNLTPTEAIWLAIGFTGQALFGLRFLVQWIATERSRRSVIPLAFWYFSIAGGMVLFCYAVWRRDPVFIVGQCTGLIIYGRNLYFIMRERREMREAES